MSPHAGGCAPAKPPGSISEVCIETLPRGIIEDVAMTLKLKGLRLRILPGHEVFLMNPTNAPVQVWVGCLCAGFLKGKWVTGDEHDASDTSQILCKFEDAHSKVFYEKELRTVGDLVVAMRQTRGETRVRYHKIIEEPKPADPGFFRLELEKSIYWRMDSLKIEQNSETNERSVLHTALGAAFPVEIRKSPLINIIWTVRWSPAGLTPVKPSVVFATDFQLSPARAVMIAGSELLKD
jgi:hypothetical protein